MTDEATVAVPHTEALWMTRVTEGFPTETGWCPIETVALDVRCGYLADVASDVAGPSRSGGADTEAQVTS